MQISVNTLAAMLGGTVEGDPNLLLHTVAKIEEGFEGALSFLANTKYEEYLYTTGSSAVLVNKSFVPAKPVSATLIKVDDAYAAFTYLLEKFSNVAQDYRGVDPNTFVHEKAKLGEDIYLGAFSYVAEGASIGNKTKIFPQCYIGKNVKIGNNCLIYPGVKIYHESVIGDNCIIHSGTVIGSDGFGFAPLPDRSYKKIPQTGNVIIEDDVEIGANCAIDRATMGSTYIRKGAKLDNLVQLAHNTEVGAHSVMAGQSGLAGSTKLGRFCVVGGQVGIAGHLVVADGNQFGGQSGVQSSIHEPDKKWFGSPAMEVKDSLRASAIIRKLPELLKRLEQLEKEIKHLKGE